MRRALILCLLCLATPALAECPPEADTGDRRAELHNRLLQARSEDEARGIANALWQIWTSAPDATAQDLLDRGMARREAYDFAGAEAILDELVAYCPAYAEGYNQRAFARFLRENFDGSLADLDVVLEINPYHFGALSGKALSLMGLGRIEQAQAVLRQAVKVHPFLQERAYLIELPEKDI